MSIAEMKLDLIATINGLEDDKLEEVYGAVQHCLNDDDEWNEPFPLSELEEAISDADNGIGIPVEEVMKRLKEKYGLNG